MPLFRTMLFCAVPAGLLAGLLMASLQQLWAVPLILRAEIYEAAAQAQVAAPAVSVARVASTALADIVAGVAFALLLIAVQVLRGGAVGGRRGLVWGLAGFVVFVLAPSLGLPPELPGTASADIAARQVWWIATAAATATGLGLLAFRFRLLPALLAVGLVLLPHLIGAPQPGELGTLVPAALAHEFIAAVLVTGLVFWAVLGVMTGVLYDRFLAARPELRPVAA